METRYFNLLIFLFSCSICFSQGLNKEAEIIKNSSPNIYKEILTFAKSKWQDNHEMIVYTINKQAGALAEIANIMETPNFDKNILSKEIIKWKKDGLTDYEMALYSYKKQFKAKSIYETVEYNDEIEEVSDSEYVQFLSNTSQVIRTNNPQVFKNIVTVVENQIQEYNPKKIGHAINKQIEAMGNMSNPRGNDTYNQDVMTMAISRNLQMKDGQALIDYIGVLDTYKEIIKKGEIKFEKN